MPKHSVSVDKPNKKAVPKKQHLNSYDYVDWPGSIGADEYLIAVSTDAKIPFNCTGVLGNATPPTTPTLVLTSGPVPYDVPYSLTLVNTTTGTNTAVNDGNGAGLYLVIDTIGGMGGAGCEGEGDGSGGGEGQG